MLAPRSLYKPVRKGFTPLAELLCKPECTPEYKFLWRCAEAFMVEDYPCWAFDKEHQWYAIATKMHGNIDCFAVQFSGRQEFPVNHLLDMGHPILVDDGSGPVTDIISQRGVKLTTALLKYTPGARVRFWVNDGSKRSEGADDTSHRLVFDMTENGLRRRRR